MARAEHFSDREGGVSGGSIKAPTLSSPTVCEYESKIPINDSLSTYFLCVSCTVPTVAVVTSLPPTLPVGLPLLPLHNEISTCPSLLRLGIKTDTSSSLSVVL